MSNKKTPFDSDGYPSEVFRYDIYKQQGIISHGYNFRNRKDMILLQEGTILVNFIEECEYDLSSFDIDIVEISELSATESILD